MRGLGRAAAAAGATASAAAEAAADVGGRLMQRLWWGLRQCLRLGLMREADAMIG